MQNEGELSEFEELGNHSPVTRKRSGSSPIKMISRPTTPKKISSSLSTECPSKLAEDLSKEIHQLSLKIKQDCDDEPTDEELNAAYLKNLDMEKLTLKKSDSPSVSTEPVSPTEDFEQFLNIEEEDPAFSLKHNPSPLYKTQDTDSDVEQGHSDDDNDSRDNRIFPMDEDISSDEDIPPVQSLIRSKR